MPGGHGGGRRHTPPSQQSARMLWDTVVVPTVFAATAPCTLLMLQTKPGEGVRPYLELALVVGWWSLVAVPLSAGTLAELGRRGGKVPGWVGRHPSRAAALLWLVATAVVATVVVAVGWGG